MQKQIEWELFIILYIQFGMNLLVQTLLKKLGITYSKMEEMGIMTPLVDLSCHYIHPANYEDELTIRVSIAKLTPARIEFYYEVYKEDLLLNTGSTVHAWVGKDLRPLNMKKKFTEIYEKIESIM